MSSNEHPDMSGNPCDAPFVCAKCGSEFGERKLCGSFFDEDATLCSKECSVEYDYAIAERLTAENARLRELLKRWLVEVGEQQNMVSDFVLWTETEKAIGRTNNGDF